MINADDIKVAVAAATGLLNWAVNIDIILQMCISVVSLIYIILKICNLLSSIKAKK